MSSIPGQLELCEPYAAGVADYRVVAMEGPDPGPVPVAALSPGSWTEVARFDDYEQAADRARCHCVAMGCTVWVYDRNDGNRVVLRVLPQEYRSAGAAA